MKYNLGLFLNGLKCMKTKDGLVNMFAVDVIQEIMKEKEENY